MYVSPGNLYLSMGPNYWLVKSEPGDWSIEDHEAKGIEHWDGVRNHQANNNMKKMQIGDLAYLYHSISDKAVVGVLKVVKEHYPDFTDKTGVFGMVDFEFVSKFKTLVPLEEFKRNSKLSHTALVKQGRLSVMPLTLIEWNEVERLSQLPSVAHKVEKTSTQKKTRNN